MTASKLYRVESFVAGLAIKAPCQVATNADVTLSGVQTINGWNGSAGDRILVKDQLKVIENGVYSMETSAWRRAGDFDGTRDVVGGTIVPAWDVSTAKVIQYEVVGAPATKTPGTDGITFAERISLADLNSYLPLAGGTMSGPIVTAELTDYMLTSSSPASSSGAITFDIENGNAFEVTLTENITGVTISNAAPSGDFCEIIIKFKQDSTGSWTVGGWPAAVKWPGGTAPTITTTLTTGTDMIALKTWDAGITWYGDFSQDYS